jgi:hypothetical protein
MERWEKAKTMGGLFATILIPLAVVFVGQEYARATKEREIGAKYVELAIGILRSPPKDEHFDVRAWAVEVVDRHSGVKLSDAQKEYLKRTGVLEEVAAALPAPAPDSPPQPPPQTESPAPTTVTVPNVRGLTFVEARHILIAAGLKPLPGGAADTALVDVQEPRAGTQAQVGAAARLTPGQRTSIPLSRLPRNLGKQMLITTRQ